MTKNTEFSPEGAPLDPTQLLDRTKEAGWNQVLAAGARRIFGGCCWHHLAKTEG